MSSEPPPLVPDERARRRERRRRQVRRRRLIALGILVLVAGGAAAAALAVGGGSSPSAAGDAEAPAAAGATSAASQEAAGTGAAPAALRADGSLGAENVRLACSLLERDEIKAQFGGPVGKPTPIWPSCQWSIGRDAWVAVRVLPTTSIERTRDRSYVLEDVGGLAEDAFFGTDRYLYFGDASVSYSVVFQKVGEFTELREDELLALARSIVARPLDGADLPSLPFVPRGPADGAAPTKAAPLQLYFGGDSLSAGPEWAFYETVKGSPLVDPSLEYQVGTGVVRSDYFDWKRHLQGVLGARQPDVVIFMSGANDNQDFVIDGVYHPVGTKVWRRNYTKRVSAIMDELVGDGRTVIWVGMPPMRDEGLDAGMQEVNAIVAREAEAREIAYVDTYELFSAPGGGYADALEGASGEPEQVRLEDGIHLNVAGSYRLAGAILQTLVDETGVDELAEAPS